MDTPDPGPHQEDDDSVRRKAPLGREIRASDDPVLGGGEIDPARESRTVSTRKRYSGRVVLLGLAAAIAVVLGIMAAMFFHIQRSRQNEHVDLPNTPRGNAAPGFPPPPPDLNNPGTTHIPAH